MFFGNRIEKFKDMDINKAFKINKRPNDVKHH